MNFLSNWDPGITCNDIWGYADDYGNEYAILGSATMVHFLDVTDPTNPILIDEFAGGASTIWRDMKTYGHYAYAVADQGSEGLMIFDLCDIHNGNIQKVYQQTTAFSRTHNIYIDPPNARLYAAGSNTTNSGLIIFDLSQDPANPTVIGNHGLPGQYVHDVFVKHNIAYCSHGYNGLYIYDYANANSPVLLSSLNTGGYNHSSWITEDETHIFYAEEVPLGRLLGLIDITDLTDISITSTFTFPLEAPTATNVTYHNPYIVDNYAVISGYQDGVVIVDIADRNNPFKAAHYDTQPNNTSYSGYSGCWGVYPFLPSGNIIASDVQLGLFVVETTGITPTTTECFDGVMGPFETGVDCGGFCKRCTPCGDCPDSDNDTVCDADDVCPGGDDTVDTNGNGIPDACDGGGIAGCTDPNAHNYNSNATQDDGSCETCTDGDLNGDETSIDCGGVLCEACPPCDDPEALDSDGDTVCDAEDVCPGGDDRVDSDGDGIPDDCDYCNAAGSQGTGTDYLNFVRLNTIANSSGQTAYSDFTSISTELRVGQSYTLSITLLDVYSLNAAYGWIDYNRNGIFEASESISMSGFDANDTSSGTVTVPATANRGTTRMRVRSVYLNPQPSNPACGNYYGEVEDYTIIITDCSDDLMNGDETDVDCGGSCPPCGTCNDGVMNGAEMGVDCGGPDCVPCPTCYDGIMNGDELGIDCGSPECPPCECIEDGIMNGSETGIDCGGPACPPCPPDGCEETMTLYGVASFNNIHQVNNWIESTAVITGATTDVSYLAGNYILMKAGFDVQLGVEFLADIQPCTTLTSETPIENGLNFRLFTNKNMDRNLNFGLEKASVVKIEIFTTTDANPITIQEEKTMEVGSYQLNLDKLNLEAALYLCKITIDDMEQIIKIPVVD